MSFATGPQTWATSPGSIFSAARQSPAASHQRILAILLLFDGRCEQTCNAGCVARIEAADEIVEVHCSRLRSSSRLLRHGGEQAYGLDGLILGQAKHHRSESFHQGEAMVVEVPRLLYQGLAQALGTRLANARRLGRSEAVRKRPQGPSEVALSLGVLLFLRK